MNSSKARASTAIDRKRPEWVPASIGCKRSRQLQADPLLTAAAIVGALPRDEAPFFLTNVSAFGGTTVMRSGSPACPQVTLNCRLHLTR